MSINWLRDAEPSPALLVLPPGAASLDEAHAAIELWEHYSCKTLDPTQRLVVEVMMAEDASRHWAARTTGREMPRQNGKGDEIEVVELWGLVQRGEAILHTAHELFTVSNAYQRMLGFFQHRDLRPKKRRELNGLGQQMIECRGGGVIQYRTRTKAGGRGLDDISRLVVDEAQHVQREQLASSTPTLLANPNPQMNFAGTSGIEGQSEWWWELRLRALSDNPGSFGYVGHTAERITLDQDGQVVQHTVDASARRLWFAVNPALVYGRTTEAFLAEQYKILGPEKFAREHLGVWDPPPKLDGAARWQVIPEGAWSLCHQPHEIGLLRFALDVDVNERGEEWCSVGCSDGTHLGVVDVSDPQPGTDWVVPAVAARAAEVGELLVPRGPADKLIDPLEKAGVRVRRVTADEFVRASMAFADAVAAGEVWHLDQPRLTRAAAVAARKDVGDGAWRFTRTGSAGDISPLTTVMVARWAAMSVPQSPVFAY